MRHFTDLRLLCTLTLAVACSGELNSPGSETPTPGDTAGSDGTNSPLGPGGPGGPSSPLDPAGPGSTTQDPSSPGGPSGSPGGPDNGPSAGGAGAVDPDIVDAVVNKQPLPLALNDGEPVYARAIRLTHDQWERSVSQLLAMPNGTGARMGLTDDAAATSDFSNNESLLYITGTLWADYAEAAKELAATVANDPGLLSSIYPGEDANGFITTFGRRAFRRPLNDEEISNYQAMFDTGVGLTKVGATDFARGAGLVIEAMLQSPNFLYRVELTPAGQRLTGYEIAAKLSLLLRGTTPDDALLDMAAQGQLDSDDGVAALAQQMVEEPAFVEVMRNYHGEMFRFSRFLQIEKDPVSVPEHSSELNQELQDAAYRFFDYIVANGLGVRDILLSDKGYVGPRMASFYDVQAPGSGLAEVTMPAERPGFFTQLPFLILNSVNQIPDSIHRGVALNLEVLCAEVPPPAQGVSLPSAEPGQTNRQRVDGATGDGTCGASCHGVYINPLGFAFENFDGLGRLRDMDNGQPVDTSATYPFVEGNLTFSGAPELMQIIADGVQVHDCYAKHLAGFALQRYLIPDDEPLLDAISATSQTPGSSIKQMMLDLVSNPAFTTRPAGGAQ